MYGKKYVCGIDNIEYFVPFDKDHPIQDCELQIILNGVYLSWSAYNYSYTFCIIYHAYPN